MKFAPNEVGLVSLCTTDEKRVAYKKPFFHSVILKMALGIVFALLPFRPAFGQFKSAAENTSENLVSTASSGHSQLAISEETYVIAREDLLYIDVFEAPEFSREYRVGLDGFIAMPLLNSPIKAAGATLKELRLDLSTALQKANLVSDPRVSISVEESPFHTVTVTGSVTRPAVYPLTQNAKVLDAVTAAGGATDGAGDSVELSRISNAPKYVSLKRVLAGDTDANVQLEPGDTITVESAPLIYVTGAVNHAGAFAIKDETGRMTVLRAMALAEDAKSTAALSKARIIHRDSTQPQHQTEIPINLKKIVSGRAPDVALSPNDILFVPESSGKKAAFRGAEAAVQTASGIVVFGRY